MVAMIDQDASTFHMTMALHFHSIRLDGPMIPSGLYLLILPLISFCLITRSSSKFLVSSVASSIETILYSELVQEQTISGTLLPKKRSAYDKRL